MNTESNTYTTMWEDYAAQKAMMYYKSKFVPKTRIGLTNYAREKAIYTYIPTSPEFSFLDMGCASGKQVLDLADKFKRVVGVDISTHFIDVCKDIAQKRGITNAEFSVGDTEKIGYDNEEFDVVLCSEVLEHVIHLDQAIEELKRVTKKGGYVLITVPHFNADGTYYGRFLRFLGLRTFVPLTEFTMDAVNKHGDAHVREFSVRDMTRLLEKHGLRVKRASTVAVVDFQKKVVTGLLQFKLLRKILVGMEHRAIKKGSKRGRHIIVLARKEE